MLQNFIYPSQYKNKSFYDEGKSVCENAMKIVEYLRGHYLPEYIDEFNFKLINVKNDNAMQIVGSHSNFTIYYRYRIAFVYKYGDISYEDKEFIKELLD